MKDFWVQLGSGIALFAVILGLSAATSIGSWWQKTTVAVVAGAFAWLIARFATRESRHGGESVLKREKPSETRAGPIQVFLPRWDETMEGDFYQDGAIQWKGFKQGEREAEKIDSVLTPLYHPMDPFTSGSDLLNEMERLYREEQSIYFIMTMSSKVEEVRDKFIKWRMKCASDGKMPPVLIATVASIPNLADSDNGMLRWYVRSEEECQWLATHLDKLRIKRAAAFCITRTPGVCDDSYGREGLKHFEKWFNGEVLPEHVFFVTGKTATTHVQTFLDKFPKKDWPGVFIVGYGDMVKNTLAGLLAGGYDGCIVCTSTLTDPQWRPPDDVLTTAKATIFTVVPRLDSPSNYLIGDNQNVVFFFARKTLLRVMKLTAGNTDPQTFLTKWLDRDDEGPETPLQVYLLHGDILVHLRIVNAKENSQAEAEVVSTTPIVIIESIIGRFHTVTQQLRQRHDKRSTLDVADEYDVQDLFHALLKMFFEDVRAEEWTPSYAGNSSRIDFLLKGEKTVIELKMTRAKLDNKAIREQLAIDIQQYRAHPDCSMIICFVYDPEERIINPRGFERDLSQLSSNMEVRVYVAQK